MHSNNIIAATTKKPATQNLFSKIKNCFHIIQSINFILFLSKSAYIHINLTAVDKKRRRWQNDIRKYMHMKRI